MKAATLLVLVFPFAAALQLPAALAPSLPSARAPAPGMMGRVYTAADRITFVDGNNLMMQRKVTKGRDELALKLAGCRQGKVVLVYDGRSWSRR